MTVSIIIPVYNDPEGLHTTLRSLRTTSADEIVIVDNGSTDATRRVAAAAAEQDHVRSVLEPRGWSYAARNRGINAASNGILAFLDADVTVEPDYVERALEAMDRQGVRYLGSNIQVPGEPDRFPVAQYLESQQFAPTCGLWVERSVFDEVGVFDGGLRSCGDLEFGQRVAAAGIGQGFAADAVLTHPRRSTIGELRKLMRVGRGHADLQHRYPERYGRPGRPPTPGGGGDGGSVEPVKLAAKAVGWLSGTIRGWSPTDGTQGWQSAENADR